MKLIPLKGGDEYELLTPWRKFEITRAGDVKKVKRKYNKRVRKLFKIELRIL
jgi:hypothetical protein